MSEHRATIAWQRNGADFTHQSYSRDHLWSFIGGLEIAASAALRMHPEQARCLRSQ